MGWAERREKSGPTEDMGKIEMWEWLSLMKGLLIPLAPPSHRCSVCYIKIPCAS